MITVFCLLMFLKLSLEVENGTEIDWSFVNITKQYDNQRNSMCIMAIYCSIWSQHVQVEYLTIKIHMFHKTNGHSN